MLTSRKFDSDDLILASSGQRLLLKIHIELNKILEVMRKIKCLHEEIKERKKQAEEQEKTKQIEPSRRKDATKRKVQEKYKEGRKGKILKKKKGIKYEDVSSDEFEK
jgi:hypothetical protein